MKFIIPYDVKHILSILYSNGFEAFVVGGCVRDTLLGKIPHDWDICTNAKPDEIKNCFKNFNTFDSGIKHGTISVVYNNEVYEITTYRIDGDYLDNRHPQNVTFTDDIKIDLSRRDFTINAMAYNEKDGLVDPFNGQADIVNKKIRCVRNADERFREDALRILRSLRFASTYEFDIEEETAKSIITNRELLNNIAVERINIEFTKLICGYGAESILNNFRDVIAVFIPELTAEFEFNQNSKHHKFDLWHHTTYSLKSIDADAVLRMTMLLHDIGKPQCKTTDEMGESHFIGHPDISAEMSRVVLRRMKYSNDFIDECVCLIRNHDIRYSGSPKQLKRLLKKVGEDRFRKLFKVFRADIMAQSDYQKQSKLALVDLAENDFQFIIEKEQCFSLKQLAVNGNDMISIGIKDGKKIGNTLKILLNMVIEDEIDNDRLVLLEKAKELNI
ncbi:MAG: HD domain-containing protein [Ruminococcus sp.]|nr:HD domain-containing protein [Ruminococcus sp.]